MSNFCSASTGNQCAHTKFFILVCSGVVGDKRDGCLTVTIPAETKATRGSFKEPVASIPAETVVLLPNGDQEIRTKDYVVRESFD